MNCKQAEEWIIDFLYGELDPDRARELKEHFGQCATCAAGLAQYEQIRVTAANLPDPEPSQISINRIIAQSRDETQKTNSFWGFGWVKVLGTLSMMVVVAVVVTYQLNSGLVSDKAILDSSIQPTADIRYEHKQNTSPADVSMAQPAPPPGPQAAPAEPRKTAKNSVEVLAAPSPSGSPVAKTEETGLQGSDIQADANGPGPAGTLIADQSVSPESPPAKAKPTAPEPLKGPGAPKLALNLSQPSPPPPATAVSSTIHNEPKADAPAPAPSLKEFKAARTSPEGVVVVNGSSSMALNLDRPQFDQASAGVKTGAARVHVRSLETTTTTMIAAVPPLDLTDYLVNGTKAMDEGRFQLAIKLFKEALPHLGPGHPDRPNALLGLAKTYEALGEPVKASEYYQALLAESPGHQEMARRKINELSGK